MVLSALAWPSLTGIAIATYSGMFGVAWYHIRQQRREREIWKREVRRSLRNVKRDVRRVNMRGTYASRSRVVEIERQMARMPETMSLVSQISIEMEHMQEDINETKQRLNRLEELRRGRE